MTAIQYALTGHTTGIGKEVYDRLSPNCIGFSKSTGYDITIAGDRKKIIDESATCDIFINNATSGFGQTELFLELFNAWRNTDKTIINVGSRIAEIILPSDRHDLLYYQAQKTILKKMSYLARGGCKVRYRWFSYVGTDEILRKYPHFTASDYITVSAAADIILS
jgi:hypothetical protein